MNKVSTFLIFIIFSMSFASDAIGAFHETSPKTNSTPDAIGITCPNAFSVSTSANSCTGQLIMPAVSVSGACSSYSVTINTPGGLISENGGIAPVALNTGIYIATYSVLDNCGNSSSCTVNVSIVDDIPPTPSCDQITKISLSSNGIGILNAAILDDGSTDNCAIDHFEVRRMTDNCNTPSNLTFGSSVSFCCNDIANNPNQVELRIFDVYGNYNACMVDVTVEDKQPAKCFAPANVTVNCNQFDPTFAPYGSATGTDNCNFTLSGPTISGGVDQCNTGTITRTWQSTDSYGNSSSCSQTIDVVYVRDFQVKFPDDQLSSICNDLSDTIFPIFTDRECELAGYSYWDQKIIVVPDACFKILRHWTITDWCEYDSANQPTAIANPTYTTTGATAYANDSNFGHFTYTQIIKVLDNTPPTFSNPSLPVEFCDYSTNCSGSIDLTTSATDDCSRDNIIFEYILYLDNDGDGVMETVIDNNDPGAYPITVTKDGIVASANIHINGIAHGTHKIKWIAHDGCGQAVESEYIFEVKDCKKPTILVDNGIAVNMLGIYAGTITIWPGNPANCNLLQPNICGWDPSVGDNCTPDDELRIRIRKVGEGTGVPNTESVAYNCGELGTNYVEIWVGDNADNWDFVTTYVVIENNMGVCDPSPISGTLKTPSDQGIADATVTLSDQSGNAPSVSITTPFSGEFSFSGLPVNADYKITPTKDGDFGNGINILDLLRLYQAILGNEFSSPTQKLAADVNNSGHVDVQDLILIRSLTLGKITEFANVPSWKFYLNSCNPDAGVCPGFFVGTFGYSDIFNIDFTGIKMGDITGDADPNAYSSVDDRTFGELILNTKDRLLQAGEEVKITLQADRKDILGYQFTLNFGSLEFVDVVGTDVSFDKNFALHDGALTASWNGSMTANPIFSVTLKATQSTQLSEVLSINSRITKSMAFDNNKQKQAIKLAFDGQINNPFALYQNEPNPFTDRTKIQFFLPKSTTATLIVYDTNGKTLKTVKGDFPKGMNHISLAKTDLKAAGVVYYQLATDSNTAVRRMVIVD